MKIAMALLFLTSIGSLISMNLALQNSSEFGPFYFSLIAVNGLCLITLVYLIAIDIRKLFKQLKYNEPGSKLTLRMLVMFGILAVCPVTILYGFSLQFINKSIDSWFNVEISNALHDSLDLGRESLGMLMRELQRKTKNIANDLSKKKQERLPLDLTALRNPDSLIVSRYQFPSATLIDILRKRNQAEELSVLNIDGRVVASSSRNSNLLPLLPSENLLIQLRNGQSYFGLEPDRNGQITVRVAVNVNLGQRRHVLQAIYPFSPKINNLATNVESGYAKYNELAYLRDKLRLSFTMTLTLVLLFSIAGSVWAAFFYARKLTSPILELSKGTSAIAQGNYNTSIPVTSNDDLASLVVSFNEMTRKIALSTKEIENQRNYLDAVMKQLSSGIITLSDKATVLTINESAASLLEINEPELIGTSFFDLGKQNKNLEPLIETIRSEFIRARPFWEKNINFFGSNLKKEIICRGRVLTRDSPKNTVHIIVMEDMTAILQGQRDAAWSEVAKRLAHEIKNPLTPIKLSAERLILKFSGKLEHPDREKFSQLSETIIEQVEMMTEMVDEFSGYAEKPNLRSNLVNLNDLLAGAIQFFEGADSNAQITVARTQELPPLIGDQNSLKRLFNNLIKNSIEATKNEDHPKILITTYLVEANKENLIKVTIEDRGTGIPAEILPMIFEPYITSKTRGRGLGLAIVKKIIEDHNGSIKLENREHNGVLVTMHLPVQQSAKEYS